ncbi:MAG: sulfatase, partial [Lentisphaerae bacterium]|nr:sulfatase [Lentisphaerota bacterium]
MLPSSPLRCFCPGTLLSVLLAVAPHVASSQASDVRRPNIVLILADDLGWCDTSFTGSRFYWTPNIERLARRGVYFPNAYAASPLCSPTRASIMTGQSPARCGITSPGCHTGREILKAGVHARANPLERQVVCVSATRLDTEHTTLAEALREGGYATGHFGKWHLGREPYSPLEHGFDVDIPHWPGPGPAGSFVAPWRFPNFRERVPKEHIEDRMGDEAVAFMEARKGRPFFLNYWQFSVHAPFNAKEELIEEYKKTVDPENPQQSPTYAAMIHSLDDNVGKILDALDRLGIAQDTVVIFYSDNGGNMYNAVDGDRTATSNAPLRGGKASMYEGGIRIPAIVSWPGVTKGGTTNEALIQSEDLYPTILEMAGLPTRPKQAKDGLSMVPILNGKEPLRDAVYCFFPHGPHVPDWLPPSVCVRQGDWKLIRIFHGAPDQQHRYELYDVVSDIGERRNLASVQPERVTALDALIERFLADTEAVIPTANPAYERARRESVAGWQVSSEARIGQRWDTLQVRSFGPDTALTTAVPMAAGPGRYVLDFRMRAWADGPGQVSWTSGGASHTAEASTPFALHTHGLWHDYRVNGV